MRKIPNLKFELPRKNIELIIVDDSQELLRVYERFFEMAGLKVVAKFCNAKDMLSYFNFNKTWRPHLTVLLDYGLPEMDGVEAARQLKKLNPGQRIILATAEDLSKFKTEDKLFDGMILKPFTISELLVTIEKAPSPLRIEG